MGRPDAGAPVEVDGPRGGVNLSGVSGEVWRPIPGYDGWYEVSNLGGVRSWRPRGGVGRAAEPRTLAPAVSGTGYLRVHLTPLQGRPHKRNVHSLVTEAFLGPRPGDMQVAHLNGIRTDPRIENLAYKTAAGNAADRTLHGTQQRGEKAYSAKLTEADIRSIRLLRSAGMLQRDLAEFFSVSRCEISQILAGKLWKHVA